MSIPTEPIGSIPRPPELIEGLRAAAEGQIAADELESLYSDALKDTIARFEQTDSPVITDGEQRKPSFVTYAVDGLPGLAADGAVIPFADGHTRQLPRLTQGPFRYQTYAATYLADAQRFATRPLKQAVISASAMSLLYPTEEIEGYPREAFLADLVNEAEADIRRSLAQGADSVQVDFTEGRLSLKLDPSGGLLRNLVELNNSVFRRFTEDERRRIGVHTCPGGDHDSTHSADIEYAELLPTLMELDVGRLYLQLASEPDPGAVLEIVREHLRPGQRVFVGVVDPIDPAIETPETIRDRVLEAAGHIPLDQLGTTDDCGFSPFADDTSTARDTAFAKIEARVKGTQLAADALSA